MILPEVDVGVEVDIQENVLLCSISKRDEIHQKFEGHRRRSSVRHPLLAKLLQTENEDIKHSDYTAHLLIQRQTREYAFAVDDVLRVLKNSTNSINKCQVFWRGDNNQDMSGTSGYCAQEQNLTPELSQVGRGILLISEAVRRLQDEDALSFWTSQQRVSVLQQLVSFAKDTMKLYRKLSRIKGSLEDRVRNIRRAAILCECEITGNLVPSEIYYQWAKEDSVIYKDNCWDTANVSVQKLSKVKEKMRTIKNTAKNLVSCIQSESDDNSPSQSNTYSIVSQSTAKMSVPIQVYAMDKQLEILHNNEPSQAAEDSVCELFPKSAKSKSSSAPPIVNSNLVSVSVSALEDAWVPKPSQKYMDTIASNVTPSKKVNTFNYLNDGCESRITAISKDACLDWIVENEGNYENIAVRNLTSDFGVLKDKIFTNDVPFNNAHLDTSQHTGTVQKFLNDSMEQQISSIINAKNAMNNAVARITYSIREMERDWVSPEIMLKSKASGKEFYQLVDFIVDTARLTEDPTFASRLYPEDKHEIVSVLDPVLRELTNCFMSLHSLLNLVAVDVQYLKELISGFPKGNLFVRDLVSFPSIDEELAGMDQCHETSDLDIDVNELFEYGIKHKHV